MAPRTCFTATLLAVAMLPLRFQNIVAAEPQLAVKAGRGARETKVLSDEGAVVVEVFSPGGIGQITVQNGGQPWPMALKLRLRYDAKRPFTHVEGFTLTDSKSRLQTFMGSDIVEVSYLDGGTRPAAAKPPLKLVKAAGTVEAELPLAWLADEKEFTLHWVDFYRD